MDHRERFFTALDVNEPDTVPLTDLGLDPPVVEGILGRKMGFGLTKFGKDLSVMTTFSSGSWETAIHYRIAMAEACRKLDFDAVVALSDYSLATREYKPRFIEGNRFIDQWGRIMETSVEGKTTYFVGGVVDTIEGLDDYEPPDAFDPDIMEMMERIVKPIKGEDVVLAAQCHSGWHLAFQARGGIEKISLDFYQNPDFARKLMDKIAKACQRFAEAMI
jgi:hypothetical protein